MDYNFLAKVSLFSGIEKHEIANVLNCIKAKEKTFLKGENIYRIGERVKAFGLVISGSVSIENDDIWGNHTVLDHVCPGKVFAETYACAQNEALLVNVTALEETRILFIDIQNVMNTCSSACKYHQKLIRNLLTVFAQKNLSLSRRSFHTAPKSIRARVLSYLSFQSVSRGSREFDIPFNRQQMADYLSVDRSALSAELSKMQKEGILRVKRNHFVICGYNYSDSDICI